MAYNLLHRRELMLQKYGWLNNRTIARINEIFGILASSNIIAAVNTYLTNLARTSSTTARNLVHIIENDPLIICCLQLTVTDVNMPIRFVKGNGSAYVSLNIGTTSTSNIDITYKLNNIGQANVAVISNGDFEIYNWGATMELHSPSKILLSSACTTNELYRLIMGDGTYRFYINNTLMRCASQNIPTQSRSLVLFALNRGGISYASDHYISAAKINNLMLLPYTNNSEIGFINVNNLEFYGKTGGTGSLQIEYLIYEHGSWTTWTPPTV